MAKRFLIEEEQRQRVRAAALKLEVELLDRLRVDPDDDDARAELSDVQNILERVGREATYTEGVAIARHDQRLRERRA